MIHRNRHLHWQTRQCGLQIQDMNCLLYGWPYAAVRDIEVEASFDLFPVAISRATTPKLYTSDSLLALPVLMYSGARYPNVPARTVVWGPNSWSMSLARPKSPSLTLKLESSIMLLDLMSLCTTHCSHSS
nr:hypothetical protein Ahy_A03g011804 [Ipomoea trifida]